MKNKISCWLVIGLEVGTTISVANDSITADILARTGAGIFSILTGFIKQKITTKYFIP